MRNQTPPVYMPGVQGPPASRLLVPIDVSRLIPELTVPFHLLAPAGTVVWTDSPAYTIPAPGRIKEVTIVFPPGPGGDLHVRPMLIRHGQGADQEQVDLLPYVGNLPYVNGDSHIRTFGMQREVRLDTSDRIVMRWQNVDMVNDHELIADVLLTFDLAPVGRVQAVSPFGGGSLGG